MSKVKEAKVLTTLCDKLQNLQMLSDSDICIEVENCLTDIECYSKINSANHIGFVKIEGFNDEDRRGQRYIFKTEHVQELLLNSTKKYIPEELTNNGIVYRLSHINKEIKILKYEKGDHFKGKHCDGTHVENIDGACHKSLLTLIVYLNEGYKGGQTTLCKDLYKKKSDEVEIKPRIGKIVILSQTIPHYAKTVTQGIKYLLMADIMYIRK